MTKRNKAHPSLKTAPVIVCFNPVVLKMVVLTPTWGRKMNLRGQKMAKQKKRKESLHEFYFTLLLLLGEMFIPNN